MAMKCISQLDVNNIDCQMLMSQIPTDCMSKITNLIMISSSIGDICNSSTTSMLLKPNGVVFDTLRCMMQNSEIRHEMTPYLHIVSQATINRIFCIPPLEKDLVQVVPYEPTIGNEIDLQYHTLYAYTVWCIVYLFYLSFSRVILKKK